MDVLKVEDLKDIEVENFNKTHMLMSYNADKGYRRFFFISKEEFVKFTEDKIKYICVPGGYLQQMALVYKDEDDVVHSGAGKVMKGMSVIVDDVITDYINNDVNITQLEAETQTGLDCTLKTLVNANAHAALAKAYGPSKIPENLQAILNSGDSFTPIGIERILVGEQVVNVLDVIVDANIAYKSDDELTLKSLITFLVLSKTISGTLLFENPYIISASHL